MKKITDKRKKQYKLYRTKRDKYMSINKICEVDGCKRPSCDLHHKKGKEGELLYKEDFFMAVCRTCHNRITVDSRWAIKNGYSLRRSTSGLTKFDYLHDE